MTATAEAVPTIPRAPHAVPVLDAGELLASLLAEQQQLTAVERFSQRHAPSTGPLAERYYRDLLPATPPGANQQYAFEVDLDACSGCKACVTACRQMNGLDDGESFRDVGFLIGRQGQLPVLQHVTTACHHCLEPACLTACPVNAYEKDATTGIVRHLDDQCFGCQYCTLACPYDAPKYNRARGIVRKCDLCSQRLAVGEAPACVQACPHSAIRIRIVARGDVLADCETNQFLPSAPEPQHTYPTTNYVSKRPLPRNLIPADYYAVRREHSHPALVAMLVLTQLSVGTFAVDFALSLWNSGAGGGHSYQAAGALLVGLIALAASTLHLGRPHLAYRAVLGLGHSWLSREIVAFGLFALLAIVDATVRFTAGTHADDRSSVLTALQAVVVLFGLIGVSCSVMIYHSTRRPFWHASTVGLKFLLTTLLLGSASVLLQSTFGSLKLSESLSAPPAAELAMVVLLCSAAKLTLETLPFAHLAAKSHTSLKRSMMLLIGELRGITTARYMCGVLGGLVAPAFLLAHGTSADAVTRGTLVTASFCLLLAGELFERHLFFAAAVAPRMPGGQS